MENIVINASKGLILRKGRALILQRSPYDPTFAGTWEFPGGKLEFGEKLEDCLRREIWEETHLQVEVERLLYANTFLTHPWRQVVVVTYLCRADQGKCAFRRSTPSIFGQQGRSCRSVCPKRFWKSYSKRTCLPCWIKRCLHLMGQSGGTLSQ
jgi:mutator protein MutT